MAVIREIIARFGPGGFIETGTFLGHTTRFFLGNGLPVYSIELKTSIWLAARARLAFNPELTLLRGDSARALRRIGSQRPFERPLAYLDAHWWDALPLQGELDALATAWPDWIAVVDDAHVPTDPGYGFDSFRERPLGLELLRLPEGVLAALPAQPSMQETGGCRGTLYLAGGSEACAVLRGLAGDRGPLRIVGPAASDS